MNDRIDWELAWEEYDRKLQKAGYPAPPAPPTDNWGRAKREALEAELERFRRDLMAGLQALHEAEVAVSFWVAGGSLGAPPADVVAAAERVRLDCHSLMLVTRWLRG
jgi:hypothetical protein